MCHQVRAFLLSISEDEENNSNLHTIFSYYEVEKPPVPAFNVLIFSAVSKRH